MLADRIRVRRQANDLTQAELAEKLGVGPATVSNWESGRVSPNEDRTAELDSILGGGVFSAGIVERLNNSGTDAPRRNLGDRIRISRQRSGLTQNELADKVGVTHGAISHWESGRVVPDDSRVGQLESILGSGISGASGNSDSVANGASIVGAWLSKARQSRGITVPELARKAGVSVPAIYNIESGKAQSPRQNTIGKLERALGEQFEHEAEEELKQENEIEGLGAFADFDSLDEDDWPTEGGIYVFYDVSQRPIYVGQAKSIASRIKAHQDKFWFKSPIVEYASYVPVQNAKLRDQIERILIKFLKANAVLNRQQTESFSE
jgi:transcriptional regulator with XRE-family HTH domain